MLSKSDCAMLAKMGINPNAKGIASIHVGGKKPEECPSEKSSPKKRRDQYKSNAERQYAHHLNALLLTGDIVRWAYESVTLVVAGGNGQTARYTPDFMVYTADELVEFHEIKGKNRSLKNAGRVKFLAARERYWFWMFRMIQWQPSGEWKEILAERDAFPDQG